MGPITRAHFSWSLEMPSLHAAVQVACPGHLFLSAHLTPELGRAGWTQCRGAAPGHGSPMYFKSGWLNSSILLKSVPNSFSTNEKQ